MGIVAKFICLVVIAGLIVPAARGGELAVLLVDQENRPVADAVIVLHALDSETPGLAPMAGLQIAQANLQFVPDLLIVPVGSDVSFSNSDMTGHHVYSFSPAKPFNVHMIAQGEAESIVFDRVGLVVIGCNIHDSMVGFIHVVDTPWSGIAGADGTVSIGDVPAGRYRMEIWHAAQAAPHNLLTGEISLGDAPVNLTRDLNLRSQRQRRNRYE